MLKIIGMVLVIGASTGFGFSMSYDLRKRIDELKYIRKIMLMLRGEVKYMKSPLPEAFLSISTRVRKPYQLFLENASGELGDLDGKTFYAIWRDRINADLKDLKLTKQDFYHLEKIGENLGYLDGEMQLGTIDLYVEQLAGEIKVAEETIGSKSRIYNCLGVMGGMFVAILMMP